MAQEGCLGCNEKKKRTKFTGCLIKCRLLQHSHCTGMGTLPSAEGLPSPGRPLWSCLLGRIQDYTQRLGDSGYTVALQGLCQVPSAL